MEVQEELTNRRVLTEFCQVIVIDLCSYVCHVGTKGKMVLFWWFECSFFHNCPHVYSVAQLCPILCRPGDYSLLGWERVGSGGLPSVGSLRVEHSWARTHAHNLIYLCLTCWPCSCYFFLKWDFICQNISFFWAHSCTQQVLVLVFISLLSSPDVYYLGMSGYAIHQGSFFPRRQQRVHIFRICAAKHI